VKDVAMGVPLEEVGEQEHARNDQQVDGRMGNWIDEMAMVRVMRPMPVVPAR